MQWLLFIFVSLMQSPLGFASPDGNALIKETEVRIERLFRELDLAVKPERWSTNELGHFLRQHLIFSRDNAPLLERGALATTMVPALHAELSDNFQEEMGIGRGPSHFKIYRLGLSELGVEVDDNSEYPAMKNFVDVFHFIFREAASQPKAMDAASILAGAFYASEAVAISEIKKMQGIAIEYAKRSKKVISGISPLNLYFKLHLEGVEQGHQDRLAEFVRHHERYGLDLSRIRAGRDVAFDAIRKWWMESSPCVLALSP